MQLDGNALAGVFGEVFATDMTTALARCGTCDQVSPMGSAQVYTGGPAAVIRCPVCTADWGYIGRYPDGVRLSLPGMTHMAIPAT